MDEKEKAVPPNESSILLKYPMSIFSPHSSDVQNILMPVGAQESSGIAGSISSSNSSSQQFDLSDISESRLPSSICQLEQPLLFGASPNPYASSQYGGPIDSTLSLSSFAQPTTGSSRSIQASVDPYSSHDSQSLYSGLYSQASTASYPTHNVHSGSNYVSTSAVSEPMISYAGLPLSHSGKSHFTTKAVSNNDFQGGDRLHSSGKALKTMDSGIDEVKPYWLFQDIVESKDIWIGFSESDSEKLETAFMLGIQTGIPTDGGRYDVHLKNRIKKSVYYEAKDLHVRRCTWFYQQDSSMRFRPYDENTADYIEDYYLDWVKSGVQELRFSIPGFNGNFLFEKPFVMLMYGVDTNAWTDPSEPKGNPKVVKRGMPDGFQKMPNESPKVDHLLFIVQGIGSFCDLRFRTVSECVDGFRDIANKLIGSHFKKEEEQGFVGRVEILPVAWHAKLHASDFGLDTTMKMITLPSIPKLRHFTNDTLLDILLYSSPSYCQSIINTVSEELNKLYSLFLFRNSNFSGHVFVAGHSLGSLILFDILSNQSRDEFIVEKYLSLDLLLHSLDLEDYVNTFQRQDVDLIKLSYLTEDDMITCGLPDCSARLLFNTLHPPDIYANMNIEVNGTYEPTNIAQETEESSYTADQENDTLFKIIYPLHGPSTAMSSIVFPRLLFPPAAFFALGSPISMFLAIRGFNTISDEFIFPTCPGFFHIFHPYDPVAFRIEPMIDHNFKEKPALIPHHKGRKRMHLEIKESVAKFASELRQKVMDALNKTWSRLHPFPSAVMEKEVNSMMSQEIPEITTYGDHSPLDISIGCLNGGRRIDYVLQEKPLEALNDYVWALTSHATYWDSEDTVLMILREIYATVGINVSPQTEHEAFAHESAPDSDNSTKETDYLHFSKDFLEKSLYSQIPANDSLPVSKDSTVSAPPTTTAARVVESAPFTPATSRASVSVPGSQHIGPPPLSGFVKRPAFTK